MAQTHAESQNDLLLAAQRLREARTACRRFLMLWAMSPGESAGDNRDASATSPLASNIDEAEALLQDVSNPQNIDWSVLYRGGVLDD